jgi:predicted nicotinamide N-methyase
VTKGASAALVAVLGAVSGAGASVVTDVRSERLAALEVEVRAANARLVRVEDKIDRLIERK